MSNKPMFLAQRMGWLTPSARESGSQNTEKPYAMPMQRCTASAAGGTSHRLKPGAAMVLARARMLPSVTPEWANGTALIAVSLAMIDSWSPDAKL
jgi:hypothetical protein